MHRYPYFNGRYSLSCGLVPLALRKVAVLILVLMEDTLGVQGQSVIRGQGVVLILVLMEDTLGVVNVTKVTSDNGS